MLVLSRRKNEKVLFPTLGVSIEVIRSNSSKVQLGIDAPREIRVVRGELPEEYDSTRNGQPSQLPPSTIRRELETANLAIQLAKNQLQQGLNERAQDALEQAISSLQSLEQKLATSSPEMADSQLNGVRETGFTYQVCSPPLAEIVAECLDLHLGV